MAELSRQRVPAFRKAAAQRLVGDRLSLRLYARDGNNIGARMFAPLSETWGDPATGSARRFQLPT
jgi:trans-2,3-dihydro-3-hydroxyanthranilate isomerase